MSGLIYKDLIELDIVSEHFRVNVYWDNFVCVYVVRTYDVVTELSGVLDNGTT